MGNKTSRNTIWRQGHVLPDELVAKLGLCGSDNLGEAIAMIVSHDCDIVCDAAVEPHVEIVIGKKINAIGADAHAKNARRLHLEVSTTDGPIAWELSAPSKRAIPKDELFSAAPKPGWLLTPAAMTNLQIWLSIRYRRAAFAEEFEDRLKKPPGKLAEKIAKASAAAGSHLVSVYFDVDEGREISRHGSDDVYELMIYLLYGSANDANAAYVAVEKAAQTIINAFEKHNFTDGTWKDIRLMDCIPISDASMAIAQARALKQWRLEYMSLREDDEVVKDP